MSGNAFACGTPGGLAEICAPGDAGDPHVGWGDPVDGCERLAQAAEVERAADWVRRLELQCAESAENAGSGDSVAESAGLRPRVMESAKPPTLAVLLWSGRIRRPTSTFQPARSGREPATLANSDNRARPRFPGSVPHNLAALLAWIDTNPELPGGTWCKDSGSFELVGEGRFRRRS